MSLRSRARREASQQGITYVSVIRTKHIEGAISYLMMQSDGTAVEIRYEKAEIMADSSKTQISTAQAAWSAATLEEFETFLQTPQPKVVKGKDGAPDELTEALPSAPNLGANISAEWAWKLLQHPISRTHSTYKDELVRVSRFGAYLVVAAYEGRLKVPRDLQDDFDAWYKEYSDAVSAGMSGTREKAKVATAERKVAVGKLSAMQRSIAASVAAGILSQEQANAILSATED